MAFPLIPVLGALALGGLVYALSSKSGPPGSHPSLPGSGPMDDSRRAQIRAHVQDLLVNGRDPGKMEEVATAIEPFGFAVEAAALRARAQQLRMLGSGPAPTPPGYKPASYEVPPDLPLPSFPIPGGVPAGPAGLTATVTGDPGVNVRTKPSVNASFAEPNDAYKGKRVVVLNWNAAPPDGAASQGWAHVISPGGATGFASKASLRLDGGAAPSIPIPPLATPSAVLTALVTGTPGVNVRTGPGTNHPFVTANDAFKGTKVLVLNWNAAPPDGAASQGWAQVVTPGGSTGFASKASLVLQAPAPATSGGYRVAVGNAGLSFRCAAPGGCRLRANPSSDARSLAMVRSRDQVRLLGHVPGQRADARSPGATGGWAKVAYGGQQGWVPSEWLVP